MPSRPGVPQIELAGIRKVFGDRQRAGMNGVVAVDGADLTVDDGELFAILGPSGSGKTTVLRMIAGFEQPTAGTIRLGGVDVTALPARRRDVNTVFQEYALFPHMTVGQNVEYGMKVRGVSKAERRRRTADALDMVRLDDHGQRKPAQLSGGQRQRVALARALAPQPRVLLLDEPLTALDARLRDTLRTEIDRLLRSLGVTTVYVTHDQSEAMALGDRIAVMDHGRIAQIGKPQNIYFRPANAFVADFIGTMNVLRGTAAGDSVILGAGSLPLPESHGGGEVTVMFRPEDVTLGPVGESTLSGRVTASFFLGDQARVIMAIDAGADAAQSVTARVPPRLAPAVGDLVGINVSREALLLEQKGDT